MTTESQHAADDALRSIRAHAAGVLRIDEIPVPIKFVLSRTDHAPVFPLDPRLLEDDHDCFLCLPDDSFDLVAKVVISPRELEPYERELDRDRHLAYHGSPDQGLWMLGELEFVQLASGTVADREHLAHAHPLTDAEPSLCRTLNEDRDKLRTAVTLMTGATIAEPLAVGVDPHGFDVRAGLGIVRVEFPSRCDDQPTAAGVIETLLSVERKD